MTDKTSTRQLHCSLDGDKDLDFTADPPPPYQIARNPPPPNTPLNTSTPLCICVCFCTPCLLYCASVPVAVPPGLDHSWGVELYGELLEIGGGKERMTKYFKVGGMCVSVW